MRALYGVHLICITHRLLGVNPVHLILAFFVLREPLRPGPRAPSIPATCIRSYDFAPLRASAYYIREGSVVDEEREGEMEMSGENMEEKKQDGKGRKESTKSRGERGYCSQYHGA